MKRTIKIFAFILLALLSSQFVFGQAPKRNLELNLTYQMVQGSGTNASAVAWDPNLRLYFTVIAGNAGFPMEGFDVKGASKYQGEAGVDMRGMYYDPNSKTLRCNAAGEAGWYVAAVGSYGIPGDWTLVEGGQNQPDFQSVGALDYQKKKIVFRDNSVDGLAFYSLKKPSKIKKLNLDLSQLDLGNVNETTVGFTGVKGYEFVLLDYMSGTLHFFDRKGKATAVSKFPSGAPLNDFFAFSFANGMAFLYDKEARTWTGYRVF